MFKVWKLVIKWIRFSENFEREREIPDLFQKYRIRKNEKWPRRHLAAFLPVRVKDGQMVAPFSKKKRKHETWRAKGEIQKVSPKENKNGNAH